ncbi:MAG: phosphodiester glycosidase family protein [Chthoniobacteraceae bacterium]
MKLLFALFGLLIAGNLRAEWKVTASETVPTTIPALQQVHKVLENHSQAEMEALFFSASEMKFQVVDNPGNDSPLDEAMQKHGTAAGVNGGFFHPDGMPLGLLISGGKQLHPLEHAKLLSGLLVVTSTHSKLLRMGELKSTRGIMEAIQAGPFLVDHGQPVSGLNNQRAAARTVVASDGKGHFALILCRVVTLAEMAEILTTPGIIKEMKVERALNLDGGSSSAMWVKGDPDFYSPEGNRVRNFLAIAPR